MTPPSLPPVSRRSLLALAGRGLAWGGVLSLAGRAALPRAWAREDPEAIGEARRRAAIRHGCAYIAQAQRGDGGFGRDENAIVALTALSILTLMANGSTDGRGPYGEQVRKGIDFLLLLVEHRNTQYQYHDGYFYHPKDRSSRMHGQGYATLALATALGTSTGDRYRRIRSVVQRAVSCIQYAQTESGGFGYEPNPSGEHEGSVTVTAAQGLRAARDAGLLVDDNVVRRGLAYLKRSQNSDGSFRYAVYVDRSSYALTAAAVSSFFLYGKYNKDPHDDTVERGLDYMMNRLSAVMNGAEQFYFYGHFYAAWACWQKDGDEWDPRTGGYWARWHRIVYPALIEQQRLADGGWRDDYSRFQFDDVLATSFAVLTLSIPDEGVPLFQR